MAEINAPSLSNIGLFGTFSLGFLILHAYKFDRCRCLIPRKKDWFRCVLVWMLFISNAAFNIWAWGWSYVKYDLGWIKFGQSARPWPSALFPPKYQNVNLPLTIMFGLCYGLQACLTIEEAAYFYYLMRSVRRPQAAVPFLRSWYFRAWVLLSIVIMAVQQSIAWIYYDGNLETQLSKELLTGGILEMIVLLASSTVVLKFPKFLREVEQLGASPDVRIRLYTYASLNKIRTFFRFTFSVPLLIFGIDGHTKAMIVNMNALASDMLASMIGGSLAVVMMISIILYLPRVEPSSAHDRVMVGVQTPYTHQLMSLLREGGQWEGLDVETPTATTLKEKRRSRSDDAPFASATVLRSSWGENGEEAWQDLDVVPVPKMLAEFSSPIAVNTEAEPAGPIRIQMHVERDVREDREENRKPEVVRGGGSSARGL